MPPNEHFAAAKVGDILGTTTMIEGRPVVMRGSRVTEVQPSGRVTVEGEYTGAERLMPHKSEQRLAAGRSGPAWKSKTTRSYGVGSTGSHFMVHYIQSDEDRAAVARYEQARREEELERRRVREDHLQAQLPTLAQLREIATANGLHLSPGSSWSRGMFRMSEGADASDETLLKDLEDDAQLLDSTVLISVRDLLALNVAASSGHTPAT